MSNISSEQGSIAFTKTGFSRISKAIIQGYNERQNTLYQFACNVYDVLAPLTKAKQKLAFDSLQHKNDGSFGMSNSGQWFHGARVSRFLGKVSYPEQALTCSDAYHLEQELFRGKGGRLCKPRKSAFKAVSLRGQDNLTLSDEELHVTLDKDECRLDWKVDENNHAVDDAPDTALGTITLSTLSNHKWGKREGGVFHSYSEYDEPRMSGSEYPSRRFGPVGEKYIQELHRFMDRRRA